MECPVGEDFQEWIVEQDTVAREPAADDDIMIPRPPGRADHGIRVKDVESRSPSSAHNYQLAAARPSAIARPTPLGGSRCNGLTRLSVSASFAITSPVRSLLPSLTGMIS